MEIFCRILHRAIDDNALEEIKTKIDREKLKKARLEKDSQKTLQSMPSDTRNTASHRETTVPSSAVPSARESTVTQTREAVVQQPVTVKAEVQTVDGTKTEVKAESSTISVNINLNIQNDSKQSGQSNKETSPGVDRTKEEEPASKIGKLEVSCDTGEPMEVEHGSGADNLMETEESVIVSSSSDQSAQGK